MKIIMLGHKRIPSREGGVEIVVEELATRMVSLGHEVIVYNRGGTHIAGKEFEKKKKKIKSYKGVQIKTIPTCNDKRLNAIMYSFFATIKASLTSCDILHFHAEGQCVFLPLAKLLKKRCIVTVHGLDWQRSKWGGFATKVILLGEKHAAKYADEIIVLSNGVQEYFKETYQRETSFIPNGIVIPEKKEANLIKKYQLEKESYLLFLARIVPEKGLDYLLDAYKELDTTKKLVLVGSASHSDDYFDEIKAKVAKDKRIIMTGFLEGDIIGELYSNCAAYILPSDVEGMPLSLLEAMSYGCKCITSDIKENKDVLGCYGTTFQKSNAKDLRNVIEKALNEEKQDVNEQISYIREHFDWDQITNTTLQRYKEKR